MSQVGTFGSADEVSSQKTKFERGDILFGKLRPYLKKVAQVDRAGVCSTDVLAIRPRPGTDPRFLLGVLSNDETIHFATSTSAGTKMPRTSWASLSEYPVLLPPLPEQKKIAAILSSVDDAIRATQAVIDQTRRVKEGLLQELLTRGIGPDGKPHTRFKQTEIGEIPEEWEVYAFGDLCGGRGYYGANVPKQPFNQHWPRYVRITDIDEDGRLRPDEPASIDPSEAAPYMLNDGDILLARSGATVGKAFMYRSALGPCAHAGYLVKFSADTRVADPGFLFQYLQSQTFSEWVRASARAGAQPNINAQEYAALRLGVPPIEEQRLIVARCESVDASLAEAHAMVASLAHVKSGLLSDLLTGRVRVTP
ncbi:MAG: restriction endonuclease subunit S [Phycisphaeraceae bacterium]|nr:restriction endonuclease subunit S [Phycisphaeraceae bacterium]